MYVANEANLVKLQVAVKEIHWPQPGFLPESFERSCFRVVLEDFGEQCSIFDDLAPES